MENEKDVVTGDEFRYGSLQDRERLMKFIWAVGRGFENGRLFLGTLQKGLTLEPNGLMNFKIKAKRKNGNVSLSLRFKWKDCGAEAPLLNTPAFGDANASGK